MAKIERFSLTYGPKFLDPSRRTAFFRSKRIRILIAIKDRSEERGNFWLIGQTLVKGAPPQPCRVFFSPAAQLGWVEFY